MSVWDTYDARMKAHGNTLRDAVLNRELHTLSKKLQDSLSYHSAIIDSVEQEVAIVNSDNLNEKDIFSGFSRGVNPVRSGSMVEWMDNFWLVTERDANNEIYSKARMVQCNYLLKWVDTNGKVHEQWCIVEDGTKYLMGEYEDRDFVVTRGDTRLVLIIARNKDTIKFDRETRFLIDDPDADKKLAYQLTKPLKVGTTYKGEGIYSFVLQEGASTDDDNHELGIADYYKYYPESFAPSTPSEPIINPNNTTDDGRQVWL